MFFVHISHTIIFTFVVPAAHIRSPPKSEGRAFVHPTWRGPVYPSPITLSPGEFPPVTRDSRQFMSMIPVSIL